MNDATTRKVSHWETWLMDRLEKSPEKGIACQIAWVNGAVANGVVTATDYPGMFTMLVEGVDQNKQRRGLDRIFSADTVFFVDVPKELPIIEPRSRLYVPE